MALTLSLSRFLHTFQVVSIEALIYMKLLAKRRKDLLDVTELLKAGADVKKIREYLQRHASEQLPLFESLLLELP